MTMELFELLYFRWMNSYSISITTMFQLSIISHDSKDCISHCDMMILCCIELYHQRILLNLYYLFLTKECITAVSDSKVHYALLSLSVLYSFALYSFALYSFALYSFALYSFIMLMKVSLVGVCIDRLDKSIQNAF